MRNSGSLAGRQRTDPGSGTKVSVAFLTYNHEQFVAQALESVLSQRASFDWEIVVGDDCSTDGTREILKSYAREHAERIRLLLHPHNLGPYELNLAGNKNLLATYRACRGDYIALLSGDDYWTDDRKLDKQVEFLDAHPGCALCCHPVAVEYSGDRGQNWDSVIGWSAKTFCSIEEILRLETKPEMPEPSMMIRRRLLRTFPAWFTEMFNSDYALQVLLAERGSVGFLTDCMAVHRKHSSGASRIYDSDPDFCNDMLLRLHLALNEHFESRYASILEPYIEHERRLVQIAKTSSEMTDSGTSTAVRFALEEFVPEAGRLQRGDSGTHRIVTARTAWAYAARLRLLVNGGTENAEQPAYVRVRAHAEDASVGIGVLNRAGVYFIDRQRLEPSQGEVELRLWIPNVHEVGDLVVQTWGDSEPGAACLESVELVVADPPAALLADAATRFADVSDFGRSTTIPIALEAYAPDTGRIDPAEDDSLWIVTAPTPWAYAARLVLSADGDEDGDQPAYASLRVRVGGGAVGVGVLNRAGDEFLDRRSLERSEREFEVRLRIPSLNEAGDLIVQTWAHPESSTVHLESVELVVLSHATSAAA